MEEMNEIDKKFVGEFDERFVETLVIRSNQAHRISYTLERGPKYLTDEWCKWAAMVLKGCYVKPGKDCKPYDATNWEEDNEAHGL